MSPKNQSNNRESKEISLQIRKGSFFERLRRHFFTGVFVIIPAAITIFAVLFIMEQADRFFGGFVDQLFDFYMPEIIEKIRLREPMKKLISFLLACGFIVAVGWLSTFLLVRRFITFGEGIVSKVPIIKFFYQTPKEVINTLTMTTKGNFKRVVLFEYPRRGLWSLAFATGETIKRPEGSHLVAVFLPTTPNPTSGFLLLVPREDVWDTNIPVEEGVRLIISGGILSPAEIHSEAFRGLARQPDLPPLGPLHTDDVAIVVEEDSDEEPAQRQNTEKDNQS